MAGEHDHYHPRDAVKAGINGAAILGAAGFAASAVQNSLVKHHVGPWGVFTKFGSNIAILGAAGGVFEFTKVASANLREKDDSVNDAIGGALAGAILGLRTRTLPGVLGWGVMTGILTTALKFTGGKLTGFDKDPEVDEFERKQELRKLRRRPVQELIDEVGERRGITAPGWEERRRIRIKEKYGIDVPTDN